MLPSIISPNEGAFVKQRSIVDNILLGQKSNNEAEAFALAQGIDLSASLGVQESFHFL